MTKRKGSKRDFHQVSFLYRDRNSNDVVLGTRFRDLKVFMCPVCGAAIDQFVVVDQ